MYTTTAMTRADLAEGLQEGGGPASALSSKRAGGGEGLPPPVALKVLDVSGKRASEGQFLPKKEFVNNSSRKLQGASFRDCA